MVALWEGGNREQNFGGRELAVNPKFGEVEGVSDRDL